MNIDEIRRIIHDPKASAATLRQADAAADGLIKDNDRGVDEFEIQRQELLLQADGAPSLKKVDAEIRALNLASEICTAAKVRLASLIKEADARELAADLAGKGERTAEVSKALRAAMLRWDAAQAEVGEAAAEIKQLTVELADLRRVLHNHGRPDLVAPNNPYAEMQALGVQSTHVPNFAHPVPNGYWPPADNRISRPLLRLRDGDGNDPAPGGKSLLQRAGQLFTGVRRGSGGTDADSEPGNLTERAHA